ncbi:MAG: hypothetical protein IJ634_02130 [Bacteroidales bacterium]|nr:hypothetical protein [Bacteroidales bacterium]
MKHHSIKIITAFFAVLTLAATVACQKEEDGNPAPGTHVFSLVGTAWDGRMVNPTFEDTYWDETMVFLSDTNVLLFRRAFFEGELTGARTINTTYCFDGSGSGTIFRDEAIPFHYDTLDNVPAITIEDYYPHVFTRSF